MIHKKSKISSSEVCGRETPSGGNTGMLAFADHLHAQKPIEHTTGKGTTLKGLFPFYCITASNYGSL